MSIDDTDPPYLDTHTVPVDAAAEDVWPVLIAELPRRFTPPLATLYARTVGCRPSSPGGPRPLAVGSTLPGFEVTAATPPSTIALAGRHRFARYVLRFRVEERGAARSLLHADSYAEFIAPLGTAYRTAVVGTPAHRLLVTWLLHTVAKRAAGHHTEDDARHA